MQATRSPRKSTSPAALPDNALAKKVLDEVEKIDAEAKQKKMAQLDSLEQAKENLYQRTKELHHQVIQIDKAIEAITGKHVASKGEKPERVRQNWDEVRERVGRWMEGRKGQKFGARDLVKEFPELRDVPVSVFIKPLMDLGKVKVDASEGNRRQKYFAAEG